MNIGALQALLSAALFGISPVLTKLILGEMSPLLLAGLLYLGAGLGLLVAVAVKMQRAFSEFSMLSNVRRLKLIAAIAAGGVIAPICFAYGIKLGSAFEVSVLLNFETVATTVLAVIFFHEHVGRRVWIGKILIVISVIAISLNPSETIHLSKAAILLLGACFFWGLDNNLTRDVDELSPALLAGTKGIVAGTFNTVLAIVLGAGAVSPIQVVGILTIGWVSYGISLVLFVEALRRIGASRTSTFFSSGPFIGMSLAVIALGERPPWVHWMAAVLAAFGCWVLYNEHHEHLHEHEAITHRHRHIHDEHHYHVHDGTEGEEPHDHQHTHERISHSHPHYPDIHHRHAHFLTVIRHRPKDRTLLKMLMMSTCLVHFGQF